MVFGIFVRDNQAKNWLVKCFRTQIKVVLLHERVQNRIILQIKIWISFFSLKTFSFLDSKQYMLQHSRAWPFYWGRRRETHAIWWDLALRQIPWTGPINHPVTGALPSDRCSIVKNNISLSWADPEFFPGGGWWFFFTGVRMGLVLNTYFKWIECVEPTIPIPKYVYVFSVM